MENRVTESQPAPGALSGVRVIDLTSVVFGPYATQVLADWGADVIKVEGPALNEKGEGGDTMRYAGAAPAKGLGPIFMALNRNKRSVFLDLRLEEDRASLKALLATAHVFVSNVRMAGLKRLGLGYDDVRAINPHIIFAHAAGYDSDGPDAGAAAYDDLIQARCGLADLQSRVGEGGRPLYLPSLVADKVSGLFLSQAILAALYHQRATGEGQFVEVPMLETLTSFTLVEHFFNQTYAPPTGGWGYSRVLSEHRQPFRTSDGVVAMLPYSTEQWERIFAHLGRPGAITGDPRFSTFAARTDHINELYGELVALAPSRSTADWLALLTELDVPHVRLNRLEDLQHDAQLEAVGLFQRREHPQAGPYTAIRSPVKFSRTPASLRRDPPTVGQHTAEVLAELAGRASRSTSSE
jgi:crotonobetainyl-CoA:carnitine CoA-transferase CaiB-like acyl-CoA transferase